MKPSEIRNKDAKELLKMVDEKKEELFKLKLQLATGQLAKTATIGFARKDIARINTILTEKAQKEKDGKSTAKKN